MIAVNEGGPREPSEPSKSVVAKPTFRKYLNYSGKYKSVEVLPVSQRFLSLFSVKKRNI